MTNDAMPERPKGRDDVVFRQLDEEWVIFDPVADRIHALNLTAALIWSHLTGEHTVEKVAGAVGEAFEHPMSAADILPDVEDAIRRFHREGLLA